MQMLAKHSTLPSCYDPIEVFKNTNDIANKKLEQIMRRIDDIYFINKKGKQIKKTKILREQLKKIIKTKDIIFQ